MNRLFRWLFGVFLADLEADCQRIRRGSEERYRRLVSQRLAVEGDSLESVEARRMALLRLTRQLHRL